MKVQSKPESLTEYEGEMEEMKGNGWDDARAYLSKAPCASLYSIQLSGLHLHIGGEAVTVEPQST